MNNSRASTSHRLLYDVQSSLSHINEVTPRVDGPSSGILPERFPRYRRFRLENDLISHLSYVLKTEDLSNIRAFANALAPVTRAIVGHKYDGMERPAFHYKVSCMMVYEFFDRHEGLYDKAGSHLSIFTVLRRSVMSPDTRSDESILYLLANLFILAGPLIYTRRRTLKLLSHILGSIPSSPSHKLNNLHSLTCRCLIWSFSRIVTWDIVEEPIWRNAMHTIQPYLSADVSSSLVAQLLQSKCGTTSPDDEYYGAKLASMVVYSLMIGHDNDARLIAGEILHQLLIGDCPEAWPDVSLNIADCFSEIDAILDNVSMVSFQNPVCTQGPLRMLSPDEVSASWEYLASAWHSLLRAETIDAACDSAEDIELPYNAVEMWRVLLHVVNAEQFFVTCLCNIHMTRIIELGRQKDRSRRRATEELIREIQLTTQSWLITSDELERPVRDAVAEAILHEVFVNRNVYAAFAGDLQKEWRNLMEELVFCDPQRTLLVVKDLDVASDRRTLLQQQIWTDLVHYTVIPDISMRGTRTYFSVRELVAFLGFPNQVEFPCVDEYVRLLWQTLLDKTLAVAKERRKSKFVFECVQETSVKLGVRIPRRENCSHEGGESEVRRRRRRGTEGRT